jgi:hypothetical protein
MAQRYKTFYGHNLQMFVIIESVSGKPIQLSLMFARPEPNRVKHLTGAPAWGELLVLPTNIRLGWKCLPGKNALA